MSAPPTTNATACWTVSVGRVTGSSHVKTASPCQDDAAYRSVAGGQALVLAVSDGAGSGSMTHLASAVAVRSATFHVATHYAIVEPPDRCELLACAAARAREDVLALHRACADVDASAARLCDFACTLLLVLISSTDVSVLQIGDGAVVAEWEGELSSLSPVVDREYVNETDFLTTAESVGRAHRQTSDVARLNGIAVMSDGVQHLAVDAGNVPFAGFFAPVFTFARASAATSQANRSQELSLLLSRDVIDDITDDDRTLVVAVREKA